MNCWQFTHAHFAMSSLPEGIFFDLVSSEEVEAVHQLEIKGKPSLIPSYALYVTVRSSGFSPDEAATIEKLRFVYDAMYICHT
jgi:hypothetical protein